MVISRDYAAYTFRDTLTPLIGNFNLTPDTLKILRVSIEGVVSELLKLSDRPFQTITIERFEASATKQGEVELDVNLGHNFPFTGGKITLYA